MHKKSVFHPFPPYKISGFRRKNPISHPFGKGYQDVEDVLIWSLKNSIYFKSLSEMLQIVCFTLGGNKNHIAPLYENCVSLN
jgi:hypothetical protein